MSPLKMFSDVVLLLWRAKVKVEPLVFLFLFIWSFYLPLYQQYYYVRFGAGLLQNTSFPFPNRSQSFCLNDCMVSKYGGDSKSILVQSLANNLLTYGQLANRLPSILIVVLIGPISDRFGRKPVLLASAVGLTLQSIIALLIVIFSLSPYWFILANFATGICGDITGLLTGSFAYIADVSSEKWRSFRIGLTCAMFEIGVALGSFLCGLWLSQTNCNFTGPTGMVLGGSVLVLLWILILVRESVSMKDKEVARKKSPKLYSSLSNGLRLFFRKSPTTWKKWAVLVMLAVMFINAIGTQLITVPYLKTPQFDAQPVTIGIFQALVSVSSGICASGVIYVLSVVLNLPDSFTVLIGIIFQLSANVLMRFACESDELFSIALVYGVQVLSFSGFRTIASKLVSPSEQGALFSVLISAESIAALVGGLVWPSLFPLFLQHHIIPGTIFFVMASLDFMILPISIVLLTSEMKQKLAIKQTFFTLN